MGYEKQHNKTFSVKQEAITSVGLNGGSIVGFAVGSSVVGAAVTGSRVGF